MGLTFNGSGGLEQCGPNMDVFSMEQHLMGSDGLELCSPNIDVLAWSRF